jgi:hypothetical protein
MLTITTLTVAIVLLASTIAAGWPLLRLSGVRTACQVAGGAGCVTAGSTLMGLLAAGVFSLPAASSAAATSEEVPPAESTAVSVSTDIPLDNPSEAAAEDAEELKIGTLPDGTIQIPAGRPEWVKTQKPNFSGHVHTIPVHSGPYKSESEARHALDRELKERTDEYIADQIGSPLAPAFINYSIQRIRAERVKPDNIYEETMTFAEPIGSMEQYHALLEFDESFRNEIKNSWTGKIAESRLSQMGLIAGASLLLLGSVFAYFRLDNATRGYYTGRLQFMAAAAILAIVALGAAVAYRLTWL